MTRDLQASLKSALAADAPRHNVVDILSGRAPDLVGWLQVPLTPARQAAIAAFELRHRTSILPYLTDALDDIVFDRSKD